MPIPVSVRFVSLVVLSFIGLGSALADGVDDYVNSQLRRQRISGLSLAVIRDGQIVKAKAYGLANLETVTPASVETVYKIGSVSKCFVAAGVMLLVEDSKLSLDDTIDRFLDGAPEAWKAITIRHLITHTSGIPENPPGFTPFRLQSDAQVIRSLYSVPVLFAPGEKWSYSNAAYFILGEIIHKVTGKPWAEFLTERVFLPLNMTSTRTTTATDIVPHRADGYLWTGGKFTKAEDWVALRPSGAFLSTVLDLARWDNALRSRSLLKPSSWEQILSPVRLNSGKTYAYGLGFFLDPWQGHRRVYHDGQLPGFITLFEDFVDDRLSILIMMNTDEISVGRLAHSIAGFYVPALAPPVYKPLPDADAQITSKATRFIEGFVNGAPDLTLFPPDRAALVTPEFRAGVAKVLSRLGEVQSVALVERGPEGQSRSYRHRISYKEGSLLLTLIFNKGGQIVGWQYEADTGPE